MLHWKKRCCGEKSGLHIVQWVSGIPVGFFFFACLRFPKAALWVSCFHSKFYKHHVSRSTRYHVYMCVPVPTQSDEVLVELLSSLCLSPHWQCLPHLIQICVCDFAFHNRLLFPRGQVSCYYPDSNSSQNHQCRIIAGHSTCMMVTYMITQGKEWEPANKQPHCPVK